MRYFMRSWGGAGWATAACRGVQPERVVRERREGAGLRRGGGGKNVPVTEVGDVERKEAASSIHALSASAAS